MSLEYHGGLDIAERGEDVDGMTMFVKTKRVAAYSATLRNQSEQYIQMFEKLRR